MKEYVYARRRVICGGLLMAALCAAVFLAGGVPMGAVGYAAAVCGGISAAIFIVDLVKFRRRRNTLGKLRDEITVSCENLPAADSAVEQDYQELLKILFRSRAEQSLKYEQNFEQLTDYYTMWAHQIKTPIAAMRLTLAEQDTAESRELSVQLTRIEEYVDMVMCYIRLESSSTDYVIRECSLDGIIRAALRKFSSQFIRKKLTLEYRPTDYTVLTDEKWLLFVVGQVLSNSLKYTRSGGITIDFRDEVLRISDTGIGIAPEDLPRIFDKGFTGCNGRSDMKASGLGLYLCRRICRALGHSISAESSEGGTTVSIALSRENVDVRE